MIPCDDAKISRPDNKQTQANKRMRDPTRPATPPMRNTRPARKRGSNAAMTSMPKRRSGISADTGQGGLTVHRQLNARRHDRDAHLPNQTPHARLACVRASVWVCRCARRIVLHAMAAAAAQFKTRALRRAQRRTHTRAKRRTMCNFKELHNGSFKMALFTFNAVVLARPKYPDLYCDRTSTL